MYCVQRSRRRCTSVAYRKRKRKRTPSASRQEKDLSTSSLKVAPEASSATSEVEKSGTETIAESTQNVSLEELISEDVNAATSMNKAIHPPSNNTIARSIIAPESSSKDDGIAGNKFHNVRASSADSNELQQSGSTSSFLPANFKSVADAPMKEIEQETGSMGEVETAAESSKPQPLPTLKLLGFKSKYLGMTVAKASATENVTKSEIAQKGASNRRSTYECQVEALSSDGALDMYSYHRGREGLEPRDPESGDLRCPLPASDTNYNYDAPRLSCSVTIEFPLHDDSPDNNLAVYSETLSWDLLDPTTPSPLIFANGIAIEFGLKYGQMLDLAFSIEAQIESHLQQTLSYFPPISTEDPTGMERQNAGSSIQTHRYGQVTQIAPGGTILAPKERQRVAPVIRTVVRPPSSTASTTTKKKDRTKVMVDIFDDDIDDKYLQEVRRRSRAESVREIAMKCKSGVVGLLERNNNFICHICHKKCNVTYSFACGLTNHTYCELHCQVRIFCEELSVVDQSV